MRNYRLNRLVCVLLCAILMMSVFADWPVSVESSVADDSSVVTYYLDVPGITSDEIEAIKELRERGIPFTVNIPHSTELFTDDDGGMHGYMVLLCEWLSELFGIPFEAKIEELGAMLQKLNAREFDFASLVITENRMLDYFMTVPTVQRSVKTIRLENSQPISIIEQSRLPRYVFLEGTMITELFAETLEPASYIEIAAETYEEAYRMLQNEEADAFIGHNTMEIAFDSYGSVIAEDFLPLTFIPVGLATRNHELEPIISVITKALQSGSYRHLTELYRRGYQDYRKHRFQMHLNDEEKSYLRNNPVIPVASQYMSYPMSFYNTKEDRWEGAAFDVLSEMEQLTGVSFEIINNTSAELLELLTILENGTAYIMPNLIQSPERKERFLWPDTLYITDRFALLSKQDYPNIELNDIPFERVGFARGSAFADVFRRWFPNAVNATEYANTDETFAALDRGEIDLVMSSQSRLASLTNYYEYSDYKANYLFNDDFEATFGINKEHEILVSIIDKALMFIDTDRILEQWQTKTYNYEAKMLRERHRWVIGAFVLVVITLVLVLGIFLVAYIKDKKNSKATDRATKRVDTIIQNLPGMVFQHIYNPPEFTCLFVSEGCKELTGYEPNDLLDGGAVKFFDFIHPEDTAIVEKLSAETLEKGQPYENTFRIITRDGVEKWVWERSRVIEKKPDGTPYIIEGYQTDVTERMRLEAAEFEQQRMSSRIEAIVRNLPGMAFQCHGDYPDYPLTFVSEGGKELLGYTPEELVVGPNKYMEMLHPDDLPEYERNVMETLEVGLPFENTHRLIMKDGTIKWVLESCVVTEKNPDGSPAMLDGYVFDITDRKEWEEERLETMRRTDIAEASNNAKSQFLAAMSHEIRTPMNSIMGFAELASDSSTMPQIKDYLSKITDSADWLLRIINDILDVSKIEAGRMELECVPFNLYEVFTRCQSVILPPVKEKGLDLRVYAEPLAGRQLVGDSVRLYQALMNLLSNAVKFTNTGTVKFSALIKKEYEDKAAVYFEVTDSGIGMSDEQTKRIFEPFIQADSSTTRNYGGTGLGLAIVKNIVELMGGTLTVKSEPGIGSTFSFEIVFDTVESENELPERDSFVFTEKPYFDSFVLICDDNPMNQEVICEHLSRVGVRAVSADNGKVGIEMVRGRMEKGETPFDLIFMDMFMPVMDGIEAATKISALNTGTPIVAMTANIMTGELEKYKKHGMPDCLGKPFTSHELWRILLKYLKPVSVVPIGEYEHGDEETQRKLRINFVKNNQTVHVEIEEAVAKGDTKLAHRLAHSLKGSAGLIGKTGLKNAAHEVEILLKDGLDSIWDNKMNLLKTELESTLEELSPLLDESAVPPQLPEPMSAAQTSELLKKLQPLLENLSPDCITLLNEIRAVPGAEKLADLVEDYNFEEAIKWLKENSAYLL